MIVNSLDELGFDIKVKVPLKEQDEFPIIVYNRPIVGKVLAVNITMTHQYCSATQQSEFVQVLAAEAAWRTRSGEAG